LDGDRKMRKFLGVFAIVLLGSVALYATPVPNPPDLDAASDSGVSSTDNITNDTTPTFIGTKESNQTIILYNGTTNVGEDNNTGTSYSITNSALADGVYYYTVGANDGSGEANSTALSVSIDTQSYIRIDTITEETHATNAQLEVSGINIYWSSDISPVSFTINGSSFSSIYNNPTFIPYSNIAGLSEGSTYSVSPDTGLSDDAGNSADANLISKSFIYDQTPDEYIFAKYIDVGTTINEQAITDNSVSDIDYFKIYLSSKGMLDVNITTGFSAQILTPNDKNISSPLENQSLLLTKGTYLLKVTSSSDGSYSLATSFKPYANEIDALAVGNAILDTAFTSSPESPTYIYADGENLYNSNGNIYNASDGTINSGISITAFTPKFSIHSGYQVYVNGASLTKRNILNGTSAIEYIFNNAVSSDILGDKLYALDIDYTTNDRFISVVDISTNTTSVVLSKITLKLPPNGTDYNDIIIYSDGVKTYAYLRDSANIFYVYDITDPANAILTSYVQTLSMSGLSIDNDVLYVSSATGIYSFDIKTDPSRPRALRLVSSSNTGAIAAYDGKLYAVEPDTTSTKKYSISNDYDDNVSNALLVNRMDTNSSYALNKMSGKNDSDIFRFDLQNGGDLSLTSSGVDASDLNITIDDNADFSSPIVSAVNFKNTTITSNALVAGTYYVKITTTDTNSYDDYTLTNTFTPTDNAPDKILNSSLSRDDANPLGSAITVNGSGLYKIELPSVGDLNISGYNLYKATNNLNSSFATLTLENNRTAIKAGIYYIDYNTTGTFTPTFSSYNTSDEYQNNISLGVVTQNNTILYSGHLYVDNGIVYSQDISKLYFGDTQVFNAPYNINYVAQVSDGKYIYALGIESGVFNTANNSLRLDIFEYINGSNMLYKATKLLSSTLAITATYVGYNLKIVDGSLIVKQDNAWISYDISNPLSIPDSTTQYLDAKYLDFESSSSTIFALSATTIEMLDKSTKIVQKTKPFADMTSLELIDDVVYVGTSTQGVQAFNANDLSLRNKVGIAQNIIDIESSGDTLYVLSQDIGQTTYKLTTVEILKDYGDDFANATLSPFDTNITGYIGEVGDHDMFAVDMPNSGAINTTLSSGSCVLYDADLANKGGCSAGSLKAGRYYLDINGTSVTLYTLNVATTPITGDVTDSLSFYDGDVDNLTTNSKGYNSSIDVVGDIDYYKIELDTAGLFTLSDINATLVYENGQTVATDSNGKYILDVSGEYFIKVTSSTTTGSYNITGSFESFTDDKYIDKPTGISNPTLSTLLLEGNSAKILSSGKTAYLVNDTDGLDVIDLSDVYNPLIVSRINLRGTPQNITLDGTTLYVALGDDGFALVDVSDANNSSLYSQNETPSKAYALVAQGGKLFVACDNGVYKYDLTDPLHPLLLKTLALNSVRDILLNDSVLVVAHGNGVSRVDLNLATITATSLISSNYTHLVRDAEYIFASEGDTTSSNVDILEASTYTDTAKSLSITGEIKDLYLNNKVLYISKGDSYDIVEYKDLNTLSTVSSTSDAQSITIANNTLVLAKENQLELAEITPDYIDTLNAQVHTEFDIAQSQKITGQFSRDGDVDTLKLINVEYSGTLSITTNAADDINITLFDADKNQIALGVNTLSKIIYATDLYVQIKATNGVARSSYELNYSFTNDGVKDILDTNYENEVMLKDGTVNSNLYTGGQDKDYYKFVVDTRGEVSFDTNGDTNIKISLLYRSGTIIASNYNADTGVIDGDFKVTLSEGDYYVLIENASVSSASQEYSITTSFDTSAELNLDTGASTTRFDTLSAFAYLDNYSYILKNATLYKMSNILEPLFEKQISELSGGDYTISMFVYKNDNEQFFKIVKIDPLNALNNSLITYKNNDSMQEFYQINNQVVDGIADDKVMLVDEEDYIYSYDGDSLYIAQSFDILSAQQLAFENLNSVQLHGNVMYALTDNFIKLIDLSDKQNITRTQTLSTINTSDAKSIFVANNLLFVGANDKIEVWDISDKKTPSMLSDISIGFSDNDLYYTGTPTSIYFKDNVLYTTVEGIGLVFFSLDEFNTLSITTKILNLGEKLTNIFTYKGAAINYVVDDELKVYFNDTNIQEIDGTGSYSIVDSNAVQEGSSTFEGCFIATAGYGSYFDPHVKVLRDFRDKYLLHNELGRFFVDVYYENSPSIAKKIAHNDLAKASVRMLLMPIVYTIEYPYLLLLVLLMFGVIHRMQTAQKSRKKLGNI